MKLAISNIAWNKSMDVSVYKIMKKYGFAGLEIAPTRIFQNNPYGKIEEAKEWKNQVASEFGFEIPSMQSIWYGRTEKIFGSTEERKMLLDYTKQAIDFASAIGCKNLVFGCPRNRHMPEGADIEIAVAFFKEIGNYAYEHDTMIGMEANPTIYNTNFITDTSAATKFIELVDSKGFLLNLDIGTMIQNEESVCELEKKVHLINHVHISEPGLKVINERMLHKELKKILLKNNYQGYVSIEMGNVEDISVLEEAMRYIGNVFLS